MAEDLPQTGPGTGPAPAGSETGGLPADFFDDPGRDKVEAGAGANAPADTGPAPAPAPAPLPSPPPQVPAAVAGRRAGGGTVVPVLVGVLLGSVVLFLCGVLTGWALAHKTSEPLARDFSPAPPPSSVAVSQALADRASKAEVRDLGAAVEANARQVERLRARLDELPKAGDAAEPSEPPPAPDLALKSLRERVEGLSKVAERLAPVADGLKATDDRVAALGKALEGLRGEVEAMRGAVERAGSAAAKAAETAAADRALGLGVGLFKGGDYARARDVLVKQAEATPDDARLWYAAALASGMASGDWRGETERLVKRGLDRERAGTPPRVEIDAVFSGLPEQQGGRWLREWRRKGAGP
jgi:hypothetical protein